MAWGTAFASCPDTQQDVEAAVYSCVQLHGNPADGEQEPASNKRAISEVKAETAKDSAKRRK